MTMSALKPEQVLKILELTDSFNLHREAVYIPLALEENGSVTVLPDGRLRVVSPRTGSFEAWLNDLRSRLENMDLPNVKH